MNRESIFFKLNLLFFIAFIATILAGFFLLSYNQKRLMAKERFKIRVVYKEFVQNGKISKDSLNLFDLKVIKDKKEILKSGRRVVFPKKNGAKFVKIFYKGKRYYLFKKGNKRYLITLNQSSKAWIIIAIFLTIELFLIVLYIILRKNLKPLIQLNKDIIAYSNGEELKPNYINSNDEVAKINNAFYDYATKVEALIRSRKLFIRNIFHELNTPVTKGKILAELSEGKQKKLLKSIFNRLSNLLKELKSIEKVTSKEYNLNKSNIPIVELLDSAKELLYLEDIKHNITNETIYGDFDALLIVFKNLIDNGIKYGKDFYIEFKDDKIFFNSKGKKLDKELEYYLEPFTSTNSESMGLGLYIVNEILKLHNMNLNWEYKDGYNRFFIKLI